MKLQNALRALLVLFIFSGCNDDSNKPTAPPPENQESALAKVLDSLRVELDFPALAGAIVTSERVVDAQAVGCRRYGGEENVTNEDRFHLGSNTKAITALLMGVLVDEGRVSWTTTLPEIFPEHTASMRAEYKMVTVRDLLSHGSGFMRDPTRAFNTGTPREQRTAAVAWAVTQPPAKQRGQFLYSNLGYIIAGAIEERVTDRAYEELLIERVLQPLGITTAGFGAMGTPNLEDQPLQHQVNSAGNHSAIPAGPGSDNPPIYSPAGRLHMSIGDWSRYIQWLLNAEAGHPTLVRLETAQALTSAVLPMEGEGHYALGWAIFDRQWAGGRTLTHSGSNTVNFSVAWVAPNRDFAVLAATNQGGGTTANGVDAVATRLIQFHLEGHSQQE